MEFFAGVDTHRDTHYVVVIDGLGAVLDSFTIAATSTGYAEAMSRTEKFDGLVWGLEGTGSYGRLFADALIRGEQTVSEVPGTITKRHRRRLRRRGKSDPQDAHAIAEAVLGERETLPQHFKADEEEATRLLYDRRNRVVGEQTAKVNRIRALALRLEVALPNDLTTGRSLDTLESALQAKRLHGYAEVEVADEIRDLIADLRRIQQLVGALEKRMRPFVSRLAARLLELRGCSVISAAGFIGHAGSMLNYRNADTFASHAGAAPIPCSSGKHQAMRVNTGGNRQLNRCLHNMANVQMRTDGHVGKAYYDRKRAEGKTHREAMRCLKRRLASVVFRTLWTAAEGRKQAPRLAAVA